MIAKRLSPCRSAIALLTLTAAMAAAQVSEKSAPLAGSLFVYCAAGVKPPVEAIARLFEKQTGVKIEMTFANSGQLLGQIETTRTGDVFVPGDIGFAAKAQARKLISGAPKPFCSFVPALYVRKGNPKRILAVADLARPGVKLALADPSAAIGPLQARVLAKNRVNMDAIRKNTAVSPATIPDVAMAVKMGTVDAAIVWDAFANFAPDQAEIVRIPPKNNEIAVVSASVLASSKNPTAAAAFADFLAATQAKTILRAKGYTVDTPDSSTQNANPDTTPK